MKGIYSWQFLTELFPPAARFTENNIPDLGGKVYLITGGTSGIGRECAEILYSRNANVYIAGRNNGNGKKAVDEIKHAHNDSKGKIEFIFLDLGDLETIAPAAKAFLAKEERLDVLWNNAGVMVPPVGSKTKQGYEIQLGTNCLGHFAFAKLLTPLIEKTAATAPEGFVRVIWVASSAVHTSLPGGIVFDDPNNRKGTQSQLDLYSQSKAGIAFLAYELARRAGKKNVISVTINPGNLRTALLRHARSWVQTFLHYFMLYEPINGAYTMLFAGISPEVTPARNGSYIIPFGRFGALRDDLVEALVDKDQGGTGGAKRFWEYCEAETKPYI